MNQDKCLGKKRTENELSEDENEQLPTSKLSPTTTNNGKRGQKEARQSTIDKTIASVSKHHNTRSSDTNE